jgi:hypothetical protein
VGGLATIREAVFIALSAAPIVVGALAGCVIEPSAPAAPTYEADVRPIVLARCARCHGIPLMGEPKVGMPMSALDRYGNTGNCVGGDGGTGDATCVRGAAYYAMVMSMRIHLPDDGMGHMPPPPSPRLSQYQLDTIDRWSAQTPPPP